MAVKEKRNIRKEIHTKLDDNVMQGALAKFTSEYPLARLKAYANVDSIDDLRDDLRTMAISRLMLDNFTNIKAYWVMLTVPVAQVALGFGANDIDGTVHKETILHDAGATSPTALSENQIIRIVKEAGRIPASCDCNFNIIRKFD